MLSIRSVNPKAHGLIPRLCLWGILSRQRTMSFNARRCPVFHARMFHPSVSLQGTEYVVPDTEDEGELSDIEEFSNVATEFRKGMGI